MDDFYRENILDHYKNPRNSGHLEHPTVSAEGVNPLCGDELAVELDVDGGVGARRALQRRAAARSARPPRR